MGACADKSARAARRQQVEESADVANKNALVGLGVFFLRAVDETLLLPFFHLTLGKAFLGVGVETRYVRRGHALFILLAGSGFFLRKKGLKSLFPLLFLGSIFRFLLFFLFHDLRFLRKFCFP